jgi:pilus assembly protein CpaE
MFKQFISGIKDDVRSVVVPDGFANSKLRQPSLGHSVEPSNKIASQVVAVLGAKGGVGATSLAVNLAAAFSTRVPTTVVDANFQQPDVAHLVSVEPMHSVMEMLARPADLDRHLLDACLTTIANSDSRLSLLSPPLDGQAAVKANLSELAACLTSVRPYQSAWVIDLPKHLDRHFVTLADMCDKIVLVFEATVAGIATTQRWLNVFRELGYDSDRIVCVLNRSGSKYSGIEQQLETCFSDRSVFRLPNASTLIWDSVTRGVPAVFCAPHQGYSRAVVRLAENLNGTSSKR